MAENKGDLQLRGDGSSSADDEWDLDIIEEEEGGLVVFDGGSYSRGPLRLGAYVVPFGSPYTLQEDNACRTQLAATCLLLQNQSVGIVVNAQTE